MAASRVNRRLLGFGVMRSPNSPLKAAAPYFHDGQNDKQSPSLKLDHEEWDFPPKPKWMRWKTYHILHAGDIGRPEIVDALRRIAPVTAIRGNVDTGQWAQEYPETKLVRLAVRSIHVLHDLKTLDINPGFEIDMIVSGHSHVPKIETIGGVLYLNPGSAGPRRFKLPISLATVEVMPESLRPEVHNLSAG